jgi:hypothetical protein
MAGRNPERESPERRSPEQIRREIENERDRLVHAVGDLRVELGKATDVAARLQGKLPVAAAGAATAGFVLAGGLGAVLRTVTRRRSPTRRDGRVKARVGRWSLRTGD